MNEIEFGRYRLTALLGAVGMGKVYRAHDTTLRRDVAVKVLPAELASEPGYRQRFRREAHASARLSDQHIIPVYDVGEINGHLYLVMPIIEGVDLGRLLERRGPLSPERTVGIISQLGQALDAAHAACLVHRDVKPSNTLIAAQDGVYLIDFGIAHDASATKLTSTGLLVGTFAYMAPERFEAGVADARSDVYSLACVLYECLTARPPFSGASLPQLMHAHLYVEPPSASAMQASVPTELDDVIARGMAKDPICRYQSAGELANAASEAVLKATLRADLPSEEPFADVLWQPPALENPPPMRRTQWSQVRPWYRDGAAWVFLTIMAILFAIFMVPYFVHLAS